MDTSYLINFLISSLREDIVALRKIGDNHAADMIDESLATFEKMLKFLLDHYEK